MTKKRRPTALDRNIVEYMRRLPEGTHTIVVERGVFPFVRVKAEGMLAFPGYVPNPDDREDRFADNIVCIYPGNK